MKITSFLFTICISPFAIAARLPAQEVAASKLTTGEANGFAFDNSAEDILGRRGLIDDMKMKEKCKSTFKSDKTKHKAACANVSEVDAKNLCMLRSLLGDAPSECRSAMIKAMDF